MLNKQRSVDLTPSKSTYYFSANTSSRHNSLPLNSRFWKHKIHFKFSMNKDLGEHQYLIKASKCTLEDPHVFEDCFGPLLLYDHCLKAEDEGNHLSSDTVSSLVDSLNKESVLKNKQNQCVDRNHHGEEKIYIKLSTVESVRVTLSSIENDEFKINVHNQVNSQPIVCIQPTIGGKPNTKHDTNMSHTCTICHKHLQYKSKLIIHFKSHNGEKSFSCPQCESKFVIKGDLMKHLLVHNEAKSFSCDICQKAFTRRGKLETHRHTHTGEKPFSCPQCMDAFAQKGNLNQYLLIHSGVKPFSCHICHKTFTQKGNLKTHRRVHTGEKPFSCPQCEQSFTEKSSLNRHLLIHFSVISAIQRKR